MSSPIRPDRLRIAVLGLRGEASHWASQIAGSAAEVAEVETPDALLAAGADLGLAFLDAPAAAELARTAAERGAPPLALMVGPRPEEHPHARFLDVLFAGKRDWERTFDAIVHPLALLDRDGAIVRGNRQLARAVGCPIEGLVGAPLSSLLGQPTVVSGDRHEPFDPVAETLKDGRPRNVEVRYERLLPVHEVITSPLFDDAGAVQGLVVTLRDVSERRDQQERLLRAARLTDIGQLAGGVAHEINTPLASIALRAESLLKAAQDPRLLEIEAFKNFPRYLKTIDEEIFRCKRIIGSLLEFSRARKPEVRDSDLNALAERAADLVGHQMKLKQVTLSVHLDAGLPRVPVDESQIRQALIALLMNALDATPAGGHVSIETRREGEGVVLTVVDTGVGIPAESKDKIFSPFFTTKPLGQGTGLGLAICHGIVASHGGEIRVESEVDKGTRLSLVLPLSRPARPEPATPTP
ncbi:MAG TPA: ATP-binding protein [Vicinamibacteria bacterium]|nr:ATP-binding protein [Vicinamibacteria bacterium]